MRHGLWIVLVVLAATVVVLVGGCDSYLLDDVFTPDSPEDLEISPDSLVLPVGEQFTFEAIGGTPPYRFAVDSGGGAIIADTGVFTAPVTTGSVVIRVTDARDLEATASVSVVANGASLTISPSTIDLNVGQSITFAAVGGVAPYSYQLESGDGDLDTATGEYTAPGHSGTATIRVVDSDDPANTRTATVTVAPASALGLSPTSVTIAADGEVTFAASGGVPPYSFTMTGDGWLTGESTYRAPSGAGSATVTVADSDTPQSSASATVTVVDAAGGLEIYPPSVTLFTNGSMTFSATGGDENYTFSVAAGGGTIDAASGVFSAPSSAGPTTVRVTDGASATAEATVTVIEPLSISPASAAVSIDGTVDFSAAGGTGGYTYAVSAGNGSVDPSTGLYNAPGEPGSATVTVTDSASNKANAAVTITSPQPLVITPSVVSVLIDDTVLFVASGGSGGYTYTVLSGGSGSIDATTGVYTAPSSPGVDVVRVTDGSGTKSDATVTIVASGPLEISPTSVLVPVNGSTEFSASGGVPPYSYSVTSGPGSVNAVSGVYSAEGSSGTATVEVADSDGGTSSATVTIAGSGCGESFTESEPNDSTGPPWEHVDDFGITLVPDCSVTIHGTTDSSGDSDVFRLDAGDATFVSIIVTWESNNDEIDVHVRTNDGSSVGSGETDTRKKETLLWSVDTAGSDKFLEIEVEGSGGEPYTVKLTAS